MKKKMSMRTEITTTPKDAVGVFCQWLRGLNPHDFCDIFDHTFKTLSEYNSETKEINIVPLKINYSIGTILDKF